MSLESAKEFLNEFQGNADFRSSFENAGDDEARRQLAHDAGYDFTKEEVSNAMRADAKISDDDLEAVAGGKSAAWIAVGIGAAALAA